MADQYVEPHPILHDFTLVNDEIVERSSKRIPLIIKREERCDYCNTRRFTRIDVYRWEIIGSRQYKYDKKVTIVRMSKSEYLKKTFLAATTIAGSDLKRLSS